MHDLIAAQYRFKRRTERLFLLEENVKQDRFAFLNNEAIALSAIPEFVTGVLDACIYANTEVGYAGEKRGTEVLKCRYNEMFWYKLPHFKPDFDCASEADEKNR